MTPQDFVTIVTNMVAAAQARSIQALDATIGSILRAILEAVSSVALWLQALIFQLLQITRAATSSGADLDSWMADFGLVVRIQAVPGAGAVTSSRFTTGQAATIAVGSEVQTSDGSEVFQVVADPTNPAYNATQNAYLVGSSVASVTVAVQAVTPGAASNVGPGLVNTLSQAIPYIDTVTNAAAMSGGADAESDTSLRARFILAIASVGKATYDAIVNAVESVSPALTFQVKENVDTSGAPRIGFFYVAIDDGSGATPAATITAVNNAVELVRPFTVGFAILSATSLLANVAGTIVVKAGFTGSTVVAAAIAAVTAYINALPVGGALSYAQLSSVIVGSSQGVQTITGLTLNGGTSDLTPLPSQVIKAGTIGLTS